MNLLLLLSTLLLLSILEDPETANARLVLSQQFLVVEVRVQSVFLALLNLFHLFHRLLLHNVERIGVARCLLVDLSCVDVRLAELGLCQLVLRIH